MPIFENFFRRLYIALAEVTWWALGTIALVHVVASWVLLSAAGEGKLSEQIVDFAYYYVTTATTVGYGDLSPGTAAGRLIAAFFVLPGGIAIFTAVLGKTVSGISGIWRRRMNGWGDYAEREGHTVVLGWQETRTRQLIELLQAERLDKEPPIVLVATRLDANPMPDIVDYVRTDRLADPAALLRAGAARARSIVIRGQDDDETLAATLEASHAAGEAHVVAHFEDERAAELLKRQCPKVEAIRPLSSELLARASRDPGASTLANLLFSAQGRDTAFSLTVPRHRHRVSYAEALLGLKRLHNITLVGISRGGHVDLNCEDTAAIEEGQTLYYIADRRLDMHSLAWDRIGEGRA